VDCQPGISWEHSVAGEKNLRKRINDVEVKAGWQGRASNKEYFGLRLSRQGVKIAQRGHGMPGTSLHPEVFPQKKKLI
jgi:hypothetical protein